jgi:riboflavin biosynthesis pyrimidine reductase
VHRLVNDLERPIGTHLYGRRMCEGMVAWEHPETFAAGQPVLQDFAPVWQAADKVVYSTTLDAPSSARTRIEREFDPEAVRRLKEQSARDVGIGGPGLAAHAIRAGLVDEWQLFLTPITVGAASPLPDCARVELELIDEGRFGSEVVYVHYRTRA